MSLSILHIHQDYPDGRNLRPPTKAVANLIESVEQADNKTSHFVLSINRTSNPFACSIKPFEQGLSVVYFALPINYIYKPMIYFWSVIVSFFLRKYQFNYIHAHKLTTEGMFGFYLSKKFQLPFLLSIRGGSDQHNIKRLASCRSLFQSIYKSAQHIFFVSPWMKPILERDLNIETSLGKESNFPNICNIEHAISKASDPSVQCNGRYVTILDFTQFKRKGILPLIQSFKALHAEGITVELDIYGGGCKKIQKIIENEILQCKLSDFIHLKGRCPNKELVESLPAYNALLLPSSNETFGMVYVEALAARIPILYHSNTGIDGYFSETCKVGLSVVNQDVAVLSSAIKALHLDLDNYKAGVLKFCQSNHLAQFTRLDICRSYLKVL